MENKEMANDFIRAELARQPQNSAALLNGGKMGTNPQIQALGKLIEQAKTLRAAAENKLKAIQNRADAQGVLDNLQNALSKLKTEYLSKMETLKRDAFNAVFKLDGSTDPLVAREALNQATAMHSEQEAEQRYWLAKQTNDETLVSALALQAWRQGWRGILTDYFGSFPEAASSWQLYQEIDNELTTAQGRIKTSAYFHSSVNTGPVSGAWADAQG